MSTQYKYEEIKSHFTDFIHDENHKEFVKDHHEDLHQEIFNNDNYIIGREKAREWLGDQAFNIINIIKDYENENFGKVSTDFSEPEKVVNMYTFIIGEQIVQEYYDVPENFKPKIKAYLIKRTQTITDEQIVYSTSEDGAFSCLEDDKWDSEDITHSDTEIEELEEIN